jgi:guanylate kinase
LGGKGNRVEWHKKVYHVAEEKRSARGPCRGLLLQLTRWVGLEEEQIGDVLPDWVRQLVNRDGPVPEIARYVRRPEPSLLVVLTGPSGVGKDATLARMQELNMPFHYVITVTTRERRPGERDGVHYHFRTREEFAAMLARGELLEHAEVYGNAYGIPKSEVVDPLLRGEDVIMKPDVQGAATIRELEPEAISIFLAPPSMEELAARLYSRKTEDPQELARRLEVARAEMQALGDFDYVVVNHQYRLDDTVQAIATILKAEKRKVNPCRVRLMEGAKQD